MKTPNAREQRLIAILILVAVIAIVWLAIVSPIADGFAARAEERRALLVQHARNETLAASLPALRSAAGRQRQDAARFAIVASNRRQAVDLLRERVRRTAQRHGIVIKSLQEVEARAGWVGVRADGASEISALTAFLSGLQNEPPYLLVDSLAVTSDAALQSDRAAPLEIRFAVSAPLTAAAGG